MHQESWFESLHERLNARLRILGFIDDTGGGGMGLSICELSRDSWDQADGCISESHLWMIVCGSLPEGQG